MSRIKLLFDVIEDIRSLGDSLQVLADAMASDEPIEEPKKWLSQNRRYRNRIKQQRLLLKMSEKFLQISQEPDLLMR